MCAGNIPSLNDYTLQTSILIGYAVLVSVKPVSNLGLHKSPGCSCVSKALEGTTEQPTCCTQASPHFVVSSGPQ